MAKRVWVGVDLGGTSMVAVATSGKGKIKGRKKRKTRAEEGASAVLQRLTKTIRDAVSDAGAKKKHIRAIGLGMPGPLNPVTGVVYHAPNLGPTWNNTPVTAYLEEQFGCPVFLDNDVNVGVVGEHELGAGQGHDSLVAIFVGTGIGGGIILDGDLYRGTRYTAGEVGHIVLVADGPLCGCGKRGCAEAVASRTAIERDIRAGMEAGRESVVAQIMAEEGRDLMTSSVIEQALDRQDALTNEVMAQAEYYMGLLVASVVNMIDPEVIVLGGGIVERLGDRYLDPVREVAEQYYLNQQDKDRIQIVATGLKGDAGVLGAAMLAKRSFKRSKK